MNSTKKTEKRQILLQTPTESYDEISALKCNKIVRIH